MSSEKFRELPKKEEKMSTRDYNSLAVEPFEGVEDAATQELWGRNLESVISDLPPIDAIVLRLSRGVLADVPMNVGDIVSIFRAGSPKANRVTFLNEVGVSLQQYGSTDPDFDHAVLFLLGHFSKESVRLPNRTIAKITGRSGAFVQNSLAHSMQFLRANAELIKEDPDVLV